MADNPDLLFSGVEVLYLSLSAQYYVNEMRLIGTILKLSSNAHDKPDCLFEAVELNIVQKSPIHLTSVLLSIPLGVTHMCVVASLSHLLATVMTRVLMCVFSGGGVCTMYSNNH